MLFGARFRHSMVATGIAVGGLVLLIGLAALREGSSLRALSHREAVRRDVDTVAVSISDELHRVERRIDDAAAHRAFGDGVVPTDPVVLDLEPYAVWLLEGSKLSISAAASLPLRGEYLSTLIDRSRNVARPVSSDAGQEVVLVYSPLESGAVGEARWLGAALPLDELLDRAGATALVRSAMDIRLQGEDGTPFFWSTPNQLESPVSSTISLAGDRWILSAEPRSGWPRRDIDWGMGTLVLLAALAYGFGYVFLAREPERLRAQIAQGNEDLDSKDEQLSILLRSQRQLEHRLVSSMTVDLQTGLPNRTSFIEHLQEALARTRRTTDGGVLVVTIQFARLDELIHSMGSAVAEEIILQAADRTRTVVGTDAFLARTAERELAVCLPLMQHSSGGDLADRLIDQIEDTFAVGRQEVFVQAYIGLAPSNDGYEHGPELVTHASLAATAAAAEGEKWSSYRPETKEARISLLQLEADLQSAIDNNQLRLNFQPIVSVAEGTVVGFESLLRWKHPTESWIGPDRFIPLAESMGQMPRISEWVLRQGIAHSAQWLYLRETPIYVTINLTPRDLNRDLCNSLFRLLDEVGLPAHCLRVEITENAVIRDFQFAARLIGELNERGVRVLLDDFGTGYSSLSYLRDLPFHAVKIDKAFVHNMATQARDFGLVRSIVSLVHYLGMECIAEGVETQEQLDLIAMTDCNYWQGYLFSPPVPASDVEALISGKPQRPNALAAS